MPIPSDHIVREDKYPLLEMAWTGTWSMKLQFQNLVFALLLLVSLYQVPQYLSMMFLFH